LNKKTEQNIYHSKDFSQARIVSLFSLVGMSITGIMGGLSFFNNNYLLAATLMFASSVYCLGYFAVKKLNKVALSAVIILCSLYLLMFYLVFTGGVENTGPLWIFLVAPVSVFIHGLKRGLIDLAIFITIIIIIMFLPIDIIPHASYTTEFKTRLISSFLTVTFLSAFYEASREKSYQQALDLSKKYQQLAHLDPLTKLSNRRDALQILKREQARAVRNNTPLSLILCDVDYFKKINDQYGHNAGDKILVELAQIFSKKFREQDCIARWGGEEFLFILPQTSAENANVIAEKVQATLQEHIFNYQSYNIKVTVSMGIEQFNDEQSIDEVINSADKYLYQAKNSGRNQIFPKFNKQ